MSLRDVLNDLPADEVVTPAPVAAPKTVVAAGPAGKRAPQMPAGALAASAVMDDTLHKPAAESAKLPAIRSEAELGPAMSALANDRQRAFVEHAVEGTLSWAEAYRQAGYGKGSTAQTIARDASRLAHDERIQAALIEVGKTRLRSDLPAAIKAVGEIIRDKHHPQRLKAAEAVISRADPAVSRIDQNTKVEIIDHRQDALMQLKALKTLGVEREKLEALFGYSGLPILERQLAAMESKEALTVEYHDVTEEASDD